jgi:hypothetical protein
MDRTENDAIRDAFRTVEDAKVNPRPLPAGRDPKNGADWYERIALGTDAD